MTLRPPGTRSNLALLLSGAWTAFLVLAFVGGNGALVAIVLQWAGITPALDRLVDETMWSVSTFQKLALLGLAVDAWVGWHRHQESKRRMGR